jgi:hypothetical protein
MTNLVFAKETNGEHLTGNMDFYTVYTLNAMTQTNYSAADAGQNLLRVGEIIGMGAQPVILSVTAITNVDLSGSAAGLANQALYGLGSAIDGSANSTLTAATVYMLKFSIEHSQAFVNGTQDGTVANTVAYALKTETALAALPYTTTISTGHTLNVMTFASATTKDSSVTYSAIL